jgi:hypothetical protein
VSAEAAADFAAGLDFGSRSTFDAAVAAFALVTSLLDFAMLITFPGRMAAGYRRRRLTSSMSVGEPVILKERLSRETTRRSALSAQCRDRDAAQLVAIPSFTCLSITFSNWLAILSGRTVRRFS